MAQLPNDQHRQTRKRSRPTNPPKTTTNPPKRRKLNTSDTTNNSIEEKECDIVFTIKIKVDNKDKLFDCYKNKNGTCQICFKQNTNLVTISPKCKHTPKYCLECIKKINRIKYNTKGIST
eukprot:755865_1